jgi:hypothetical protein
MGNTVTPSRPTQAEDTSTRLQAGVRNGLPVMIPGAWERRARRPIVQAADPGGVWAASPAAAPAGDRERLERAREGGGALSERPVIQPKTILARMWRFILHPAGAIVV